MSNPNANSRLTNKEKWSLESKAKQGWKCYFIERDANLGLGQTYFIYTPKCFWNSMTK